MLMLTLLRVANLISSWWLTQLSTGEDKQGVMQQHRCAFVDGQRAAGDKVMR